jgi:hypothetical protein
MTTGTRRSARSIVAGAAVAALSPCVLGVALAPAAQAQEQDPFDVVATGLDNPRHLQFGADGVLYIAESGRGGDGPCVPGPEGDQVCYGATGAITAVRDGEQERVVTGLPSAAAAGGAAASGPSDVALLDGDLLITVGYGGDPAARAALPAEFQDVGWLLRADEEGGATERVADVAGFEGSQNPAGGPMDSNPNAVLVAGGRVLVVDAGGNSLLRVRPDEDGGSVSTVATFASRPQTVPPTAPPGGPPAGSQIPAEAVPTSVTEDDDGYVVGELTGFPFAPGGAQLYRVASGADPEGIATGFTNVVEVESADGVLYVVELARDGLLATPPDQAPVGRLLRVDPGGGTEVVADGLIAPGGVAVESGNAYVSTGSVLPGGGQVVMIPLERD